MRDQWVEAEIIDIASHASSITDHVEVLKLDELFIRSSNLCRLLDYLWAELLAGRASSIKAYSIALDVFGKDESFDAQRDTTVRVAMGKLRKRLAHFHAKSDSDLKIELPKRSYVLKVYRKSRENDEAKSHGPAAMVPTIHLSEFKAIGNSRELPNIAQGLFSELLTALSKFSGIQVSRAVTPDSPKHLTYKLSGSLRQSGNLVRVSAELESERSAYIVWSEKYDFSVEELIGFDGIEKLAVKISVATADTYGFIAKRLIAEAAASSTLLTRCYSYLRNHDLELHGQLISEIKELVENGSVSAQTWSMWSLLNLDSHRFGFNEDRLEAPTSTAINAARHATELDPQNAFAFRCLSLAHFYAKDFRRFKTFGLRSIELNPSSTDNRADYGYHLWLAGAFAEGITQVNISLERSVDPPNWYHHVTALEAIRKRNFEDARSFKDSLKGYQTIGDFFLAICIAGHLGEKLSAHDVKTAQRFLPTNALEAFDKAVERWHVPLSVISLVREGLEKAGYLNFVQDDFTLY